MEIKEGLLRKAWDGNSQRSGPEMIALIQERVRRGKDLPLDHMMELAMIDDEEARAVRALNMLEKMHAQDQAKDGKDVVAVGWSGKVDYKPPTIN
jgi:hypothetical protein